MTVATELEEAIAERCIGIITAHIASFHERGEDPGIEEVLACGLETLDTALLLALADALKA
jgi:hypothetical protein